MYNNCSSLSTILLIQKLLLLLGHNLSHDSAIPVSVTTVLDFFLSRMDLRAQRHLNKNVLGHGGLAFFVRVRAVFCEEFFGSDIGIESQQRESVDNVVIGDPRLIGYLIVQLLKVQPLIERARAVCTEVRIINVVTPAKLSSLCLSFSGRWHHKHHNGLGWQVLQLLNERRQILFVIRHSEVGIQTVLVANGCENDMWQRLRQLFITA